MVEIKDFFVNEREFIIYHEHKQRTVVEDLLMEPPDEEVRLATPPQVTQVIEEHPNNISQLNQVNMRYNSMAAGGNRSGLDSSLFLTLGAGLQARPRQHEAVTEMNPILSRPIQQEIPASQLTDANRIDDIRSQINDLIENITNKSLTEKQRIEERFAKFYLQKRNKSATNTAPKRINEEIKDQQFTTSKPNYISSPEDDEEQ